MRERPEHDQNGQISGEMAGPPFQRRLQHLDHIFTFHKQKKVLCCEHGSIPWYGVGGHSADGLLMPYWLMMCLLRRRRLG